MNYIYLTLLLLGVFMKFFTPKQPNYYFGYQLGSAKKSTEHWIMANKYASNYMIVLFAVLVLVSFLFDYFSYENEFLLLFFLILGYITIYFRIENILKDNIGE
jgi:uncharacterized membrane protein